MLTLVNDPRILRILTFPETDESAWRKDLDRFMSGDVTLDRKTVGENSVKALQRLLIFLGYSTSSSGSFSIDGDFGRGTNRGLAQFQFVQGLAPSAITRESLCYPCNSSNAHKLIDSIPDVHLTIPALERLLTVAQTSIDKGEVMCGSIEDALFHLNGLHGRKFYDCKSIFDKYGALVRLATERIQREKGIAIYPAWILSIIKKETDGVVRPRFEQHYLSKLNSREPTADFRELTFRSMSFGLGQIMGENYQAIGASSAFRMFTSPLEDQVYYIGKFLLSRRLNNVIAKSNPGEADFREVASKYNGPRYEENHYHESLERWFKEFKLLIN
jgi:peptidoglycan hydrolase-like protein with peptidoglycan-binding domain